jgi:hypothetical protein
MLSIRKSAIDVAGKLRPNPVGSCLALAVEGFAKKLIGASPEKG